VEEAPEGMRLLLFALLLNNPRHSPPDKFWKGAKHVETDTEGNQDESFEIMELLGSGGYSTVYRLRQANGESRSYTKVPHCSAISDLLNEVVVLQELALGDRDCPYIPKLPREDLQGKQCFGYLDSGHCCYAVAKVPCLCLAGIVGMPSNRAVLFRSKPMDIVPIIFKKVQSALKHAHHLNWCHLDVQPSNIIVNLGPSPMDSPPDDAEVMLIDRGCAANSQEKTKLTKFRGCFPYAHTDLHTRPYRKSWTPIDVYDHHSLVYSIATLANKGEVPWHVADPAIGGGLTQRNQCLTERLDLTISLLCKDELAAIKKDATALLLGETKRSSTAVASTSAAVAAIIDANIAISNTMANDDETGQVISYCSVTDAWASKIRTSNCCIGKG
jgi:serine/threonine protein kinase